MTANLLSKKLVLENENSTTNKKERFTFSAIKPATADLKLLSLANCINGVRVPQFQTLYKVIDTEIFE